MIADLERALPDLDVAAAGLGRAIAVELAKAGAHVVASGRRLEPLESVARQARALGRRSLALSCDVSDAAQAVAWGRIVLERGMIAA